MKYFLKREQLNKNNENDKNEKNVKRYSRLLRENNHIK